jgi:hypothetical protein
MPHDPEKYTAAIRAKLGKLADLGANAKASEDAIQEAAGKRLEAVDAYLAKSHRKLLFRVRHSGHAAPH